MRYKAYGEVIDSELAFPQLEEVKEDTGKAGITIKVGELPKEIKADIVEHKGPSGKGDGFYWLNTPGGYFAVIGEDTLVAEIRVEEDDPQSERIAQAWMRTYLLGYGLSLVFMQKNRMAVHCSAVAGPEGSILISGGSGAGKSTLADAFLRSGWKLVADDVAVIDKKEDRITTQPAFPLRKLCRDAAVRLGYDLSELTYIDEEKDKFAVACSEQFVTGETDVKAMFVLAARSGETVRIEEVSGQEKIQLFVDNLFLQAVNRRDGLEPRSFFRCLEILSVLPVYRLYRPAEGGDTSQELLSLIKGCLARL